jgi:RNA polymerase sigma factor (TIGR02999 family)
VSEHGDVTILLRRWRDGDTQALNAVIEAVHVPLQKIADARLRREFNSSQTIDPTALLNDAYMKLCSGVDVTWVDRNHFFALSSNVMRQILVDHARKRSAEKRGSATLLSIDDVEVAAPGSLYDLLELNNCLEALEKLDPRKAKVIELHAFSGLTIEEIAEFLKLSKATVDRDFRAARAWLYRELYGTGGTEKTE